VNRSTADTFLNHVNKHQAPGQANKKCTAEPIFVVDGVTFCHIQTSKMFFVMTTVKNMQCTTLIELLLRLTRVFKDYCGVLTEESVRRNFLLLYELLDEVLDRGCPQSMSTELLKAYVYNEPAAVQGVPASGNQVLGKQLNQLSDDLGRALASKVNLPSLPGVNLGERKTIASTAANKPILSSSDQKDNTIFVDVIEKLTLVLKRDGSVSQQYINGTIQLKSFLTGSPDMKMGLNEQLAIRSLGVTGAGSGSGGPVLALDDVSFHECLRWDEQSNSAAFTLLPPDGEFTLLTYRIKAAFRPPIVVTPFLERQSPNKLDYIVRVRADFPADKTAANVLITFSLPSWATISEKSLFSVWWLHIGIYARALTFESLCKGSSVSKET
jgi:AP-4 complex subunit mu-1